MLRISLVIVCLIPGSATTIGKAAYLGAMTTVFAHPGRRFGQMAEALVLALSGVILGLSWSLLGVYLGSLTYKDDPRAAYGIRAMFYGVALLFHGYLRSQTPRLFTFVLLLLIISITTLTTTSHYVTALIVTNVMYPILMAAGVILLVNVCVFPEFSSSFLGETTIETLNQTVKALLDAGDYFVRADETTEAPSVETNKNQNDQKGISEKVLDKIVSPTRSQSDADAFEKLGTISNKTKVLQGNKMLSLSELSKTKGELRANAAACKAAQTECQFELAFSVLPPRYIKAISNAAMKALVANTLALIGACESRYALLGEGQAEEAADNTAKPGTDSSSKSSAKLEDSETLNEAEIIPDVQEEVDLEMLKPIREIESGDAQLLRYLLKKISPPYEELKHTLLRSVEVISACLAYAYDVPKLPSGAKAPRGIEIEELDTHLELLQQALEKFDLDTGSALESAAVIQELKGLEPDIMPRGEIFLISSFLLNFRRSASHISDMLMHARTLVEKRIDRHGRRRIYAPHIHWRKWLYTGGEDEALPASGRKAARQGSTDGDVEDEGDFNDSKENLIKRPQDVEQSNTFRNEADRSSAIRREGGSMSGASSSSEGADRWSRSALASCFVRRKSQNGRPDVGFAPSSLTLRLRGRLADATEWLKHSEDAHYAIKLAAAGFLVTWPAFVPSLNLWYSLNRGLWAALQLILVAEVAIGSSIMTFIIRGVGTTLGSLWGWAAYESRHGSPITCAAMVFIGLIPSVYVQLGTKYPKAGMVSIVSICVVSLSTELHTVPGTGTENFLKRWIAFMIGGSVAILVELILLPVKARTRLVESLTAAIKQISNMEGCIAFGIEEKQNLVEGFPVEVFERFESASTKAKSALGAAEMFLPFCSAEPRLKGSFAVLALIYGEIVFVLRQIVDRMDNMLQLRTAYGSGPLEEFNAQLYPYRRNIAGSITLTLFAVHEAMTTKLPLPQFLPSARLAHLRMVNKVREVIQGQIDTDVDRTTSEDHERILKAARQRAVRKKYMSWNAGSAAQAEVIEYLEELTDLQVNSYE